MLLNKDLLYLLVVWIALSSSYSYFKFRGNKNAVRSTAVETFIQLFMVQYLISPSESMVLIGLSVVAAVVAIVRGMSRVGLVGTTVLSLLAALLVVFFGRYMFVVNYYLGVLAFASGLYLLIAHSKEIREP